MKKLLLFLLSALSVVTTAFGLSACNTDNSSTGNGQTPVYQGMTITSLSTNSLFTSQGKFSKEAVLFGAENGNKDNNGKHNGWYKGDYEGNDEDIDQENPFPDNESDENIEEEIKSTLDIIGAGQEIYYTTANQDIYINIHLSNPDNYEIMSFTLNGKKYSSYMFEEGSDMETLVLKYNGGSNSGIQEYTIDAIKYIDGTEIKDVIMDGDKTVLAGIKINNQVNANVTNIVTKTNAISFDVKINDNDNLISYSKGCLKAVIYDGESVVATKDLIVGDSKVVFNNLETSTLYQYAIVGYYDDLSGIGFAMNTLYKQAFYTKAIVLFDNIVVSQENVQFDFVWDNEFQNKTLTALNLYQGENKTAISTTASVVNGLLSDTVYSLVAEYKNGNKTESIYLEFKTQAKAVPEIEIASPTSTQTSVGFAINEIDVDNIGAITKIELIHANGTVVAESIDVREFAELLSNNTYTVKVTYIYDINDGAGIQVIIKTLDIKTQAKAVAEIEIASPTSTQTSVGFAINETDVDNIGAITKIELIHANGTVVAESIDVREFAELLSNNTYTVKVTYIYDINDGAGIQVIIKTLDIKTQAKAMPVVEISNIVETQTTLSAEYIFNNIDNTGEIDSIRIYNGEIFLTENKDKVIEFENLEPYTEYKIVIEYSYDLNDGNGKIKEILEKTIKTSWYGELELSNDGKFYSVVAIKDDSITNVEIPSTYKSLPVKSIEAKAFSEKTNIQTITIPDSITYIGTGAFYGCTGLEEITIPSSVTSIDTQIFYKSGIKTVYYNSSYSDKNNLFLNDVENVVFGGKHIPDYILYGCTAVEAVVISNNVASIGDSAFYNCTSLTNIEIPDNVRSIGSYAFYNCRSLTSVVILDSVQSIGYHAFDNCTSLVIYCESSSKPSSWNGGWNYSDCPVVWDCNNMDIANDGYIYTVIDGLRYGIKDGVATVVRQASNIITANIPLSITYKGQTYSVQSIGDYAFLGCTSLTSIEVDENNANYKDIDGNLYTKDGKSLIQYAIGKTANTFTIPNSVQSIGDYAFAYCDSSTSIVIGDSVKRIGEAAFWYCSAEIKWGDNPTIQTIGDFAFYYYLGTSIVIPNSVQSIGDWAFSDCDLLTSIVIPNSVQSIGKYAFYNCSLLTSVVIGDSVQSIGDNAFLVCDSLTSVVIGDNVQNIGDWAFSHCNALTSIVIPDSVQSIGNYAFDGCSKLTSVVIGDNVKSIGQRAFSDCNALTSIVIGNSVQRIGEGTFIHCSSLKSVVIPDSVQSIGNYAFDDCSSLTSIVIGDSVRIIGYGAFAYCDSLSKVYYRGSASDWINISIDSYNPSSLTKTNKRYYYIENESDLPNDGGNYWHYVDGVPTAW